MTDYDHAAIDEILHSRVRLAIVAFLAGAKTADFAAVRDATKTTDGNASVHLRKLEDTGYVEMQKRLFALMEEQMAGVPGAKEAKAAMAMMPDLRQAQNLIKAMQGVMSSGGSAFESMQRVMGDFTRIAQQTMPGLKR